MIARELGSARAPVAVPAVLAALGCAALATRTLTDATSLIPTALVGVVGITAWSHRAARGPASQWITVTLAGTGMLAATLAMGDVLPPIATPLTVGGAVLAGIAEEAFFRRFLYGWLERWGAAAAVVGAALAFGLIHVPVYGWAVLPLDIAAGLVLGWQRWATGSWIAPALTHSAANLVLFL